MLVSMSDVRLGHRRFLLLRSWQVDCKQVVVVVLVVVMVVVVVVAAVVVKVVLMSDDLLGSWGWTIIHHLRIFCHKKRGN